MDKQTINQHSAPKTNLMRLIASLGLRTIVSLGLASLFVSVPVHAARWILPTAFDGQVEVSNSGKNTVGFYVKDFGVTAVRPAGEMLYWVQAGQTMRVPFKLASNIVFESEAKTLTFTAISALTAQRFNLYIGQSNTLYFPNRGVPAGVDEEVIVQNLSSQSQDGRILSWQPGQSLPEVQSFSLKGREELRMKLPGLPGSAFHVTGAYNLSARIADHDQLPDLIPNTQAPKAPAPAVSFVLANSDRSQSFVFETSDAKIIAEARTQIQKPNEYMARILIAEVGPNIDLRNQDYFSATKNPWSWQVKKVFNFAELASQSCDNNPQALEDSLSGFLSGNTPSGRPVICMWAYQVIKELP